MPPDQPPHRLHPDRATDPRQRQRRAYQLANDQYLGVALGELLGDHTADQRARALQHGADRELDHVVLRQQRIEDREFGRVDDVLGIVEDDRVGLVRRGEQRVPQRLEVARFRRWPVPLADHEFDAQVRPLRRGRRRSSPSRWDNSRPARADWVEAAA